jgi:YbbR domain-containing protein
MLRSLWKNRGTLLLAFTLAFTVWVYAINQDDPLQEDLFPSPIPITYVNLAEGLTLSGNPPSECTVRLRAPRSIWASLTVDDFSIVVDLSGRDTGQYRIALAEPQVKLKPILITELDPAQITFEIETLIQKSLPVEIRISGEPAIGYEAGNPTSDPSEVNISGPASLINRVDSIIAELDITGQRQDYSQRVQLRAIDENGIYLDSITTDPGFVTVSAQIQQGERYRLVAVIPIITGQPDFGFRITKITVIPEQVIIFSSDPAVFDALPGFVETIPIDISGAKELIEVRASLDLPDRTALVGDQNILVQVEIEAIENSMTITSPVEIQGLADDLYAVASPSSVTIFLTGPITTLEQLKPEDIRVVLDLFDKGVGTHQVTPQIIVPPTNVEASALPAMIEVTITSEPPETQEITEP